MHGSFVAYPSTSVVRSEDFAGTSEISEVFAKHIISRSLPAAVSPTTCSAEAAVVGTGVRLRFTSRVDNLTAATTIMHKFFFIDRDETRERLHTVTPEQPEVTSELLVLFDEKHRDYCHASVYDEENRMLAVHALVFNRDGQIVSYPFTSQYVSPLDLDKAELCETHNEDGDRILRFSISLTGLTGPERIFIAWQATGVINRKEFTCTPEQPEVHYDMKLDENHALGPADWVVIAVDEHERFLAQTLVTLVSAQVLACRL